MGLAIVPPTYHIEQTPDVERSNGSEMCTVFAKNTFAQKIERYTYMRESRRLLKAIEFP